MTEEEKAAKAAEKEKADAKAKADADKAKADADAKAKADADKAKQPKQVRVIVDKGTLGPLLLEKGAITDDPDYVALLDVKGQKKVEAVK